MREIGAYEAKTHLPRLLDQVERGERITITRHGKRVACLVPASEVDRDKMDAAMDKIKQIRKGNTLDGLDIRELIEEGRRF
jgi:prevent-host-death family protein